MSESTPTTPHRLHSVLTFRVPDESEKGALTTQLSVALPDVASASTEAMPGWTARLDRDAAAGTVRSVTWTAAPGTGISSDQFALFRISVRLPDARHGQVSRPPKPIPTERWCAGIRRRCPTAASPNTRHRS